MADVSELEIQQLREAYSRAFSEIGVPLNLMIASLLLLAAAFCLGLIWKSGAIAIPKPFDSRRERRRQKTSSPGARDEGSGRGRGRFHIRRR